MVAGRQGEVEVAVGGAVEEDGAQGEHAGETLVAGGGICQDAPHRGPGRCLDPDEGVSGGVGGAREEPDLEHAQPPIADMVRSGGVNPSSSMPWPAGLSQVA